ncbi:hypothetical protein IAQ61_008995, partial [Plenodomus lingam]|uniref:uncharacterized protein n=1 Tax=Leptosphaeria maculans TaxID=5022 RepID=UPI00331BB33B
MMAITLKETAMNGGTLHCLDLCNRELQDMSSRQPVESLNGLFEINSTGHTVLLAVLDELNVLRGTDHSSAKQYSAYLTGDLRHWMRSTSLITDLIPRQDAQGWLEFTCDTLRRCSIQQGNIGSTVRLYRRAPVDDSNSSKLKLLKSAFFSLSYNVVVMGDSSIEKNYSVSVEATALTGVEVGNCFHRHLQYAQEMFLRRTFWESTSHNVRMGGQAFKNLNCPRMAPAAYHSIKMHATTALKTVFPHVVVPTEMPEKPDFGDVDFLVSPAKSTTMDKFDWITTVESIKAIFGTTHGRRGFLTPDCMYFAIAADEDHDSWVQIDVKVCFKPELFTWCAFEHNYASHSKVIGSLVKPLGLTLDPEGIHIRVEEMEDTNFPGSMVWINKDPKDMLRIVGLDRRLLDAGFTTRTEIYKAFTSSWLFNPAHFVARLTDKKYSQRLEDRAPHWMPFLTEWLPTLHPGSHDSADHGEELETWYKRTRAAVRDKVFTMFPPIAAQYYNKRAIHIKEAEELRLRKIITAAIPVGTNGWKDDLPQPLILIKQQEPSMSLPQTDALGEPTPPMTPT